MNPNPLDGKKAECIAYMQAVGMWCNKSIAGEDDSAEVEDVKAKRQVLLDLGVPVEVIEYLQHCMFKAHAEIVAERMVKLFLEENDL